MLPVVPEPPACITRYADYLKCKYKSMSVLPEGDWPPSIGRQYTRLALIEIERDSLPGAEFAETMERDYIHGNVDNIVGRKQDIGLAEVFLITKPVEEQLKILMDGAPGVGKTTLSRKLCKDWASGEFLQQYHLVVFLQLRDVHVKKANTVEDLFIADDPSLKEQVLRHIRETSGENVLLILDGYDELGYEERTQHSLFLDIIKGEKLNKSSVLVTSRPYASDYLQQLECINRHVEVLGFTEEKIRDCIMQNIPDGTKAAELVRLLQERMDITSLCYIPLNCAIMLYVYKQEYSLPATLTKLFEIFILNALKRQVKHLGVNEQRHLIRSSSLYNLPRSVKESFNTLGKLAFDCMVQDKFILEFEELEKVFPDCGDVETNLLSLMTAVKSFTQTGPKADYQFLHLTIQEFLAARWVAIDKSNDELAIFMKDHLEEDRFRIMLLFLAGLSGLKYVSAANVFNIRIDLRPASKGHSGNCQFLLFMAHLIFESQKLVLYESLAAAVEEQVLYLGWYRLTPFDCLVLGHFLHWSGCCWKSLDLSYCSLTGQSIEILHQVSSDQPGTLTQIEEVDFSHNDSSFLTQVSLIPKVSWFEHTKKIEIFIVHPDEVPLERIQVPSILSMKCLTTLTIFIKERHKPVSRPKSLQTIVKSNEVVTNLRWEVLSKCESLREFTLVSSNATSSEAVSIFTSLQYNTSLEKLNLSENIHYAESDSEAMGCAIERMLTVNRTLKELNLSYCGLDDAVANHIAAGLVMNTSLESLNLSGNSMNYSTGVVNILQVLHQGKKSLNLDLSYQSLPPQPLDKETTATLCDLLKEDRRGLLSKTQPPNINIVINLLNIGKLIIMYEPPPRIELHLNEDVTADGCVTFFRALNQSHMELHLSVKGLTYQLQTVEPFTVGLTESMCVKVLDSSNNEINSNGAVSIFTSLEHNTSLEELNLSGNTHLTEGDSEAVGCAIERMLTVNRTLKVLKLFRCSLDDSVAKHIAAGLATNLSLESLDIGGSNIHITSLVCVIQALEHRKTQLNLSLSNPSQQPLDEGTTVALCYLLNDARLRNVLLIRAQFAVNFLNLGLVVINYQPFLKVKVHLNEDVTADVCVRFFRALNQSYMEHHLSVKGLMYQTVEPFTVGLTESVCVKVLDLSSVNDINSNGAVSIFTSLEHNTSLEELNLSGNTHLTEGDSEAVGCAIERMLIVNRTLKVLKLFRCSLDDSVAKHIAAGLIMTTSLKSLDISGNNIPITGVVSILKTFHHNNVQLYLDLSNHYLQPLDEDTTAALCYLLNDARGVFSTNVAYTVGFLNLGLVVINYQSLLTIEVYLNEDVTADVCVRFFRALNQSHMEHHLSVKGLTYQLQTVEPFTVGLTESMCVKVLDSSNNEINSNGAVSIFTSLEHNTSLEELNLSGNTHLTEGDSEAVGCAIERMLTVNRTLKVLKLFHCRLDDSVAKHIAAGLATNLSLESLDIGGSNIHITSLVCVIQALEHRETQLNLSLSNPSQQPLDEGTTVALCYLLNDARLRNVLLIRAQFAVNFLNLGLVVINYQPFLKVKVHLNEDVTADVCVRFFRALNQSYMEHHLSVKGLMYQTVEPFTVGLTESVCVKVLDLSSVNEINSNGAVSIFTSLEHNTSLEELNLSGNTHLTEGDSEAVGCAIERMLIVNRTLKELNLSRCSLDDSVSNHIAAGLIMTTSLKSLDISGNNIPITGVVSILKTFHHNNVQLYLDLSNHYLQPLDEDTTAALCYLLNDARGVFSTNVAYTVGFLNLGLVVINYQSLLTIEVYLNEDVTADVCVRFFRALNQSHMEHHLSVKGLTYQLQTVEPFTVGLTESMCVKVLDSSNNEINSNGAVSILTSLEHNTSLEELNLSGNTHLTEGDSEAVGCAIERMLTVNRTLKVLKLFHCRLDDSVAKHIAAGLATNLSLESLDIDGSNIHITSLVCVIQALEHCKTQLNLSLSNPSQQPLDEGTTVALCYLLNDARLRNVLLIRAQFAVNFLNLGLVVINYQPFLKVKVHLNQDVTADVCVRFFRALNQSYMEHHLSVKGLMYQTVEPFTVGLTESVCVKVLDLSSVNEINSNGAVSIFTSLEHNTSLEELNLSGNTHLTEGDSEAVGCAIERMLTVNRTLKVLKLFRCSLDDSVAKHIAAGLATNASLESLDLSDNNFSYSTDVVNILQVLHKGEKSLNLDLSYQSPPPQPLDKETTATLCDLLKEDRRGLLSKTQPQKIVINLLNIGKLIIMYEPPPRIQLYLNKDVTADGCVTFFRALNQSHMELHLSVNGFMYQTVEPFTVGLTESVCVKVLDLSNNVINSNGAVSIFTSLEHNTSLEELNLSGNTHLTEGDSEAVGCAIERMLTVNRTLKVLKLFHCRLDDSVSNHIAAGLIMTTSLKSLDIGGNNIPITGVVSILKTFHHNNVQLYLDLSNHYLQPLDEDTTAALCYLLNDARGVFSTNVAYTVGFLNLGLVVINYQSLLTIEVYLNEDVTADVCVRFFRALNQSHMEHHLSVKGLTYQLQTVEPFTVGLTESMCVKVLDSSNNEINSNGAVSIFTSLEHNTSLEELNLSGNTHLTEGDSEAVGCAIERMLTVNRTLKVLKLFHCRLDDSVAKHIAAGLATNLSLESLDIDGSNIHITSLVCVIQALEHCKTQLNLSLSNPSQQPLDEGTTVALCYLLNDARLRNVLLIRAQFAVNFLNLGLVVINYQPFLKVKVHLNEDVTADVCVRFFRALNQSYMEHHLSVKGLMYQTVEPFTVGLTESVCVKVLDLSSVNEINSNGAVSIFTSLEHNTSLEELNLSGNTHLTEGDSEAVGCAIERMLIVNRTLKELNLSRCSLDDSVSNHIAAGLIMTTSLKSLDISGNNIPITGVVSILKTFHHNNVQLYLDLSNHYLQPLDEDTTAALCYLLNDARGVFSTNVAYTVGFLNLGLVVINYQSLLTIEVYLNEDVTADVCVRFFRALNQSHMEHHLSVKGLTYQLQTVEPFTVGLTESMCVKVLDSSNNEINSNGAVSIFTSLEHNTSLEELNLSGNTHLTEGDSEAVGCAIERMLTVNRTLKVLKLFHCRLDDSVAKHIAAGLATNLSLESLDIDGSNIHITSLVCVIQALEHRETQLNLSLSNPSQQPLDEGTTVALCYLLNDARLRNVLLIRAQFAVNFLNLGLVVINYQPFLKVKVHLNEDVTADVCVRFFRALNQSYMEHHLSVKGLMYQTVEPFTVGLTESVCVKVLDLSSVNEINSNGAVSIFTSLEHNTSLEELNLSGNTHLTEGDSEAVGCAIERMLTVNRTLKVLKLFRCSLDDSVAKHIAAGLATNASLESLDLSDNNFSYSTDVVNILQVLHKGEKSLNLDLSYQSPPPQPLDKETTATLCDLLKEDRRGLLSKTQPQKIVINLLNIGKLIIMYEPPPRIQLYLNKDVTADGCVTFFRALNQSHMELHLSVNGFMYQTVEPFTVGLTESVCVKVLDLSNNVINSNGAVSIFTSLEHNTSLEELNLSGNTHLTEGDSEAVGCAIERMLIVNRTLKELNLSRCSLDDSVSNHIAAGLIMTTSLKSLDISGNNIHITGVVSILKTFHHNNVLLYLDLSDHYLQPLDEDTTAALCYLLNDARGVFSTNIAYTVAFLNLGKVVINYQCLLKVKVHLNEDVTADVCVRFFRALNQSYMEHHLSVKGLMYQTVEPFTVGLTESMCVKELDLSNNEINSNVAVSIFTSLEHNTSLEELNLSGNTYLTKGDSEAVGCAIERMLTVNRTLKALKLFHCRLDDSVAKHIAAGLATNLSLESLDIGGSNIYITSLVCVIQALEHRETQLNLSLSNPSQQPLDEGTTVALCYLLNDARLRNVLLIRAQFAVNFLNLGLVVINYQPFLKVKVHLNEDVTADVCVRFFRALNQSYMEHHLSVKGLMYQTVEPFTVGLTESVCVKVLDLSSVNEINSNGAVSIFTSLEHNTSLEELNLSGNTHLTEGDSEAVGCAIERMLTVNRTLKVLKLFRCSLDDSVANHIAAGLAKNLSLESLDIGGSNIHITSLVCVIQALEHCKTQLNLSLSNPSQQPLDEGTTVALCYLLNDARLRNVLLIRAQLAVNFLNLGLVVINYQPFLKVKVHLNEDVTADVCVRFFRALNQSHMEHHLSVKGLTFQTVEPFTVGLTESMCVKELDLSNNEINSNGAVSIFTSLEHNTSLEELNLSGNIHLTEGDSEAVGCAIERMLTVNRTLKELKLFHCGLTFAYISSTLA